MERATAELLITQVASVPEDPDFTPGRLEVDEYFNHYGQDKFTSYALTEESRLVAATVIGTESERRMNIYAIAVDPADRKRGYGRMLMRHIGLKALIDGATELTLLPLGTTTLFTELGFKGYADGDWLNYIQPLKCSYSELSI